MASVSSLDKDLRALRSDKYTAEKVEETIAWIEQVLCPLPQDDLLESLQNGVVLCQLVNKIHELIEANGGRAPPPLRPSSKPGKFPQMENINNFVEICQTPPLNIRNGDTFRPLDLWERKDPAQVLQCLNALSLAAHKEAVRLKKPNLFPNPIGRKPTGSVVSPQGTGPTSPNGSAPGRWSPAKSPTNERTSSASAKGPAWNYVQYGYMGGANRDSSGVVFGAPRQITSSNPSVRGFAEKERERKAKEAEVARLQAEEDERRHQAEMEAEEQRARQEEERKWEEETRRQRAEEKRKADEEKRRWEEEERQWRLTEDKRRKEEEEAEAKMAEERRRSRAPLSPQRTGDVDPYADRVKQLEKELELARQREKEYEEERSRRLQRGAEARQQARSRSRPKLPERLPSRQESWVRGEREHLHTQWDRYQAQEPEAQIPLTLPSRPLPQPEAQPTTMPVKSHRTGESRPLPVPEPAKSPVPPKSTRPLPVPTPGPKPNLPSRTDRYLETHQPPPVQAPPVQQTYSREIDATAERDAEDRRREQSQAKTKAGGMAGKSLLEREMEMERQRQREWEEAQQETAQRVADGSGVDGVGGGLDGKWDVGQWSGYTGGDNQNRGGVGIGAGRRQIVGPRPLPGRP